MPKGSKIFEAVKSLNNGEQLEQDVVNALVLAGIDDVLGEQEKIIRKVEKVKTTQDEILRNNVGICRDIEDNTKEIDTLRKNSGIRDTMIGASTVLGTIIGSIFGAK
jgi:hypothetical protein